MKCTHCGGTALLDRLLGEHVCINCARVVGAKPVVAQKPSQRAPAIASEEREAAARFMAAWRVTGVMPKLRST